jgi:hypothetical protein
MARFDARATTDEMAAKATSIEQTYVARINSFGGGGVAVDPNAQALANLDGSMKVLANLLQDVAAERQAEVDRRIAEARAQQLAEAQARRQQEMAQPQPSTAAVVPFQTSPPEEDPAKVREEREACLQRMLVVTGGMLAPWRRVAP